MKVALAKSGPPVAAPPLLQWALVADLAVSTAMAAAGVAKRVAPEFVPFPEGVAWGVSAFGALAVLCDLAAARMSAPGITWRRRLGQVGILAVLWRGGPLSDPWAAVATVVWMGFVWVALVVGGRALSRAVASATGEDKPE